MQINSSSQTALSLLTSTHDQAASTVDAEPILQSTSTSQGVTRNAAELRAYHQEIVAFIEGHKDGSISPEVGVGGIDISGQDPTESGKLREGAFFASEAPSEGGTLIVADADHQDRKAAVMNAYHYGMALLESGQDTIDLEQKLADMETQAKAYQHQIETGEGDAFDPVKGLQQVASAATYLQGAIGEATLNAERASTSLSRMFSFSQTPLTTPEDGVSEMTGFSISHGEYGKIMEVSSEGEITMFDQNGSAYTLEEYNAVRPEGAIGEMNNDLVDQAAAEALDALSPEERLNKMASEAFGTSVQSRLVLTVDLSDMTGIDFRV